MDDPTFAAELDVLDVLRAYESVMESIPEKANAVKFFRRVTAEIEHQRKLLDAAKDTAVELAMDIRSAYQSELDRLRKIEAAARLMSEWLHDNPATESRISMVGRILLTDLRKALETETDG